MTSQSGEDDRQEVRDLRDENNSLRREVRENRRAIDIATSLRDRTLTTLDDVEQLLDLIREQQAGIGGTDNG